MNHTVHNSQKTIRPAGAALPLPPVFRVDWLTRTNRLYAAKRGENLIMFQGVSNDCYNRGSRGSLTPQIPRGASWNSKN